MERVDVKGVGSESPVDGVEVRRLTEPLGTTDLGLNHYRVSPGEGLPAGLHAHADQEEVFIILEGEATFETLVRGDGKRETAELTVTAGEAVRFAPGEFQSGNGRGEGPLVVLALGAPRGSEDVRLPLPCPDCGHPDTRLDADEMTFVCPACGDERTPGDCPDCGGADLRVALCDGDVIVRCSDCGAEFAEPPLDP
jgi:uncharacterized cupin superfamily protein